MTSTHIRRSESAGYWPTAMVKSRRPTARPSGHARRASSSSRPTTGGCPGSSCSVIQRPSIIVPPMASSHPGVAQRQSADMLSTSSGLLVPGVRRLSAGAGERQLGYRADLLHAGKGSELLFEGGDKAGCPGCARVAHDRGRNFERQGAVRPEARLDFGERGEAAQQQSRPPPAALPKGRSPLRSAGSLRAAPIAGSTLADAFEALPLIRPRALKSRDHAEQ